MDAIRRILRSLRGDEQAATAIEYGLIVGLIGIALVTAMSQMGGGSTGMWTQISTKFSSAMTS